MNELKDWNDWIYSNDIDPTTYDFETDIIVQEFKYSYGDVEVTDADVEVDLQAGDVILDRDSVKELHDLAFDKDKVNLEDVQEAIKSALHGTMILQVSNGDIFELPWGELSEEIMDRLL